MMSKRPAIMYVSYDGMLEPLGQSQVLAYLEILAVDWQIHLISFEKPKDYRDKRKVEVLRNRMDVAGIRWTPLTYHKAPSLLATTWDVFVGGIVAVWIALRHQIRIVHVRSYIPAAMALVACRCANAKLLFDIRGFWVDERTDGGLWPANSWLYRIAKRVETQLFVSADYIVTLTHASAREIRKFPYQSGRAVPISVIPTCADLSRFSIGGPSSDDVFILGYLGSIGTWYLFDEILRCFKALCNIHPSARMLIVNKWEHSLIRGSVARAGLDPSAIDIQAADHADVPPLIRRMSAGTALIKPTYSKLASAPTKLAEYLGCGVPCLGNAGVGDMKEILEGERVGVVLNDFSEDEITDAMKRLLRLVREPETAHRCRETALRLFSLRSGASKYEEIYHQLTR